MRRNVWAAFLSAVALLFVVCASASLAADTIKIGVLAPFKTPSGESLLKAAKMAADEINAAGGILGKKIELITANTGTSLRWERRRTKIRAARQMRRGLWDLFFRCCPSGDGPDGSLQGALHFHRSGF